jgi:membrane-bound serine protease (ClpP class)
MIQRLRRLLHVIAWSLVHAGYVAAFITGTCQTATAQQAQPLIDKLILNDTIQPVTASQLERALVRANSDGSQALLICLDTPGGLLDSTRTMAGAILSSRVPVILYITPAGARAGSAGFFLLEAADIAAMTPGTNAGAAHPVSSYGVQLDATMKQKVENDAEAFLRSYVSRRNRNVQAAQEAVKSSHSYTAEEALSQNLIDVIANNEDELLTKIDGREITRMDGTKQTLHLAGARIEMIKPSMREEVLGWLINPNIAMLFLIGGALLIYLEFNIPGTIVPGTLGTLMVLLAIFALNLLPIRYTAVLLLVAAMVLMVLEAKIGGHGVLAISGIACLAFGMMTLVAAPIPELGINPWVAVAASAGFGGITIFLVQLAVRARRRKTRTGADALLGCRATAMEVLTPEGHVLVEGEIWRAIANEPVEAGTELSVVSHDQYLLHVEKTGQERSAIS